MPCLQPNLPQWWKVRALCQGVLTLHPQALSTNELLVVQLTDLAIIFCVNTRSVHDDIHIYDSSASADTHHSQAAPCQGLSIAQIHASTLSPSQQENLHLQEL